MAFLVFEGLDGSGKTSLIKLTAEHLTRNGITPLITREPGGTPLGEEIRKILLRKEGDTPTPRCEILLYEAIRAHHVDQAIIPALQRKQWVLCDRFTPSSVAFQAGGRYLKAQDIEWLNEFAIGQTKPD